MAVLLGSGTGANLKQRVDQTTNLNILFHFFKKIRIETKQENWKKTVNCKTNEWSKRSYK